jgi:hypothetical protein
MKTTIPLMTTTSPAGLSPRLMTGAERAAGRFMRAPDHDAGTGGGGGSEGAPGEGAAPAEGGEGKPAEGADKGAGGEQVTTSGEEGEGGDEGNGGGSDADTSIAGGAGASKDGEAGEAGEGEGEGGDDAPSILGAPEGDYEVKLPEALAEKGMTFDTEVFALVAPELKAMNLSNDAAQRLTNLYAEKVIPALQERGAKQAEAAQLERAAAIRKEWADAAKADTEIGGQNFDKTVDACAQVWDRYGIKAGTGFRQLLDESGLGNHPEMLRFLSRVAATTGEGSFVPSDGTSGGAKTDAEVFYPDMAKVK